MKLLNCCDAGCKSCKKAIKMDKKKDGHKLYVCKHEPKEHKSIDGSDCKKFRCIRRGEFPTVCENCRG